MEFMVAIINKLNWMVNLRLYMFSNVRTSAMQNKENVQGTSTIPRDFYGPSLQETENSTRTSAK